MTAEEKLNRIRSLLSHVDSSAALSLVVEFGGTFSLDTKRALGDMRGGDLDELIDRAMVAAEARVRQYLDAKIASRE